jgi:hypothetical protein
MTITAGGGGASVFWQAESAVADRMAAQSSAWRGVVFMGGFQVGGFGAVSA